MRPFSKPYSVGKSSYTVIVTDVRTMHAAVMREPLQRFGSLLNLTDKDANELAVIMLRNCYASM